MIHGLSLLEPLAGAWMHAILRASVQGGVAILLVAGVTLVLRRVPAGVRCWLWRLALVKMLIAVWWLAPIDLPVLPGTPVAGLQAAPISPAGSSNDAFGNVHRSRSVNGTLSRLPLGSRAWGLAQPVRTVPPMSRRIGPAGAGSMPLWPGALFLAWLLGVVVGSVQMLRSWVRTCALEQGAVPISDGVLARRYAELARASGVGRVPRLLVSSTAPGPLLLGAGTPAILLPESLVSSCSERELELILAHELSHWKRGDLRWGWLDAAVAVMFFFHPLVWLARRELRLAGEMAADAAAVEMVGAGVGDYAGLLVRVASGFPDGAGGAPSLGLAHVAHESVRTLRRRLRMLSLLSPTGRPAGRPAPWRRTFAGASLALVALVALAPWRLTAASAAPAPGKRQQVPPSVSPPLAVGEDELVPDSQPNAERQDVAGGVASPAKEAPAGEPAASTQARATERWEDVLLLEAMRYLELTPAQLREIEPLARHAANRLRKLDDDERRTLATVDRIAEQNRQALLSGRPGARQDQALLLDRAMRQRRATTEEEITRFVAERLARILTTEQIARAYLLAVGEPVRDRNRVTSPALLDPNAGFVGNAEPAQPTPGQRVAQQLREQWATRRSDIVNRSVLARVPGLKSVPPTNRFSVVTLDRLGDSLGIELNLSDVRETHGDAADNSQAAEAAQRMAAELNGHPELIAQRAVEEAKAPERAGMLELLVRRMFLSPRFEPVLQERLSGTGIIANW